MVSAVLTERRHSGGFMVSEDRGGRSRDQVLLLQQGAVLAAGVVLGLVAVGSSANGAAQTVPQANVGSGTMSAITVAQGAVQGVYQLTYISPTEFEVYLPNGELLGEGKNGTAFSAGGIGFTMTAAGTIGTTAVGTALGTNVGTSTFGTITVGSPAVAGTYDLEMITATIFVVHAPGGAEIGRGTLGAAFSAGGIGFTLSTGGTPTIGDAYTIVPALTGTAFAAGDGFTITMAANSNGGDYNPVSLTAADGTQTAAGILFNEEDATGGNKKVTVVTRAAEVNGSELIYPSGATTSQIAALNAQLTTLGIIVR